MPLYTYVVSYRGATYLSQASRSNFRGFGDWVDDLPTTAFSPAAMRQIQAQKYGGFDEAPGQPHVWQKQFLVDGHPFTVTAVQTER